MHACMHGVTALGGLRPRVEMTPDDTFFLLFSVGLDSLLALPLVHIAISLVPHRPEPVHFYLPINCLEIAI
jgi:hypothetical protein